MWRFLRHRPLWRAGRFSASWHSVRSVWMWRRSPAGGVVDAIEEGDDILAEALVRSHVDALKRKMPKPDAAVLGCTHYPLMENVFQDALGAGVRVLSQPKLVAESLADYMERRPEMLGPGTGSQFLTTGNPEKVSDQATRFLRRRIVFEQA